ncbi:hypothetical protein CLOP_g11559 [Closterium sp. NIES-67]|nr:hypothetical protein CLOP_g11559 [Closterium sp. NIES-67]
MFSDLPAERLCFAERLSQESKIGGSRGTKRTAEDLAERRVRGKSEKMGANNGDAAVLDSDDCAESLPLWSGATCWGESEAAAKHLRGASDGRSPSTSLPWWVLEALGEDEEGEGEVDGVAPTPASPADSACSAAAGGDYSRGSSVGGDPAEVESSLAGESVRGGDLICAEYAQSFLAVVPPSALSGACVGAWEEPLGAEDIGALLQAELCGDAFTARSVVGMGKGRQTRRRRWMPCARMMCSARTALRTRRRLGENWRVWRRRGRCSSGSWGDWGCGAGRALDGMLGLRWKPHAVSVTIHLPSEMRTNAAC